MRKNLNQISLLLQGVPLPVDPGLMGKLLEQSTLIIVFAVIVYYLLHYIKEKNGIIKVKDSLILEQQKSLMTLYGQSIETTVRLTVAIEELRKDLDRRKG